MHACNYVYGYGRGRSINGVLCALVLTHQPKTQNQTKPSQANHARTHLDVGACPGGGLEKEEAVLLGKLLPLLRRHRAPVLMGSGIGGDGGSKSCSPRPFSTAASNPQASQPASHVLPFGGMAHRPSASALFPTSVMTMLGDEYSRASSSHLHAGPYQIAATRQEETSASSVSPSVRPWMFSSVQTAGWAVAVFTHTARGG